MMGKAGLSSHMTADVGAITVSSLLKNFFAP
jgi:hypothetical protein